MILKDCPGGDYINANFVDMEITGSDTVNKYIATQVDFEISFLNTDAESSI